MSRKLVSVITGTYNRHDLLLEAIENVREQTYRPLEHCIVSDGPDLALRQMLGAHRGSDVPTRFVETGRQWSQFLAASISAVPFQVAQWLASGDYLMWLSDDERLTPDHVESLVNLLEETDSDFVYPRVEVWNPAGYQSVIGTDPPQLGGITHALFRAELLDYRGFTTHIGSGTDWDQIRHWMEAGARWAMLDRITLRHRIDKMGEGPDYREMRQPLRGHRERVSA